MRTPLLLRAAPAAVAAAALAAVAAAGPASAIDDTKPEPCSGLAFKDAAADQNHLQVPEGERTGSTELINGFLKHDPAKGAEATTYNITVKELTTTIPAGWTTQSWNLYYQIPDDAEGNFHFVRAILDFTGTIAYEHGRFIANPTGLVLTGTSMYDGPTNGKFFEGANGVIQLVVPADLAKAGTALQGLYASSGQGRTLPASSPPYSRGLTHVMDTAPDSAPDSGTGKYTVAPCPPAAGGATGGGGTPGGGTPGGGTPGGGGTSRPPAASSAPLPVKLAKGTVRAPRKKTLVVRLTSRETVTNLGAQLRKGRAVVGKGKLARVARRGSLKLKLSKRVKKGRYVLDLAGNDSAGQRRFASLSLRVR